MFSNKKTILTGTVIVYLLLMLVFTFADLNAELLIYHPDSTFGRCFEIVGTLPMPLVAVFTCMALVMTNRRKRTLSSVLSYIGIGLLLGYLIFYACISFEHAVPGGWIPLLIVLIAWIVISVILCRKIIQCGNGDKLRKTAAIGICGCAAAVFGPMIIKEIMSRPRFNTLDDPAAQFTLWFVRLPHSAESANSSFPSGHSAQAATSMFLLLVPWFAEKYWTKKYIRTVLFVSGIFTIGVMLSRMVLGMHYATDVITGAMITIFTMQTVAAFIIRQPDKIQRRLIWTRIKWQQSYMK
ncbi:MAG: phosphatase PAP2 family protein [Clostridiales bacterium]|nr:phosphatase PAP2 family protein [Clostridiales bacterium]